MKNSTKKERKKNLMTPYLIKTAVGLVIVILAVLVFLEPTKLSLFFPVIFILASMLCLADGLEITKNRRKKKAGFHAGWILLPAGALLAGMAVLSAVTAL